MPLPRLVIRTVTSPPDDSDIIASVGAGMAVGAALAGADVAAGAAAEPELAGAGSSDAPLQATAAMSPAESPAASSSLQFRNRCSGIVRLVLLQVLLAARAASVSAKSVGNGAELNADSAILSIAGCEIRAPGR